MIFSNARGQALVESLFTLPFAIAVVSSFFIGFHYLSSEFLADHWTYQSALCLASQKPVALCKREVGQRLRLLPFYHHDIQKMDRRLQRVEVEIYLSGPLMQRKVFSENIRLPLRPRDFRTSL